jgi:hypothetical protein
MSPPPSRAPTKQPAILLSPVPSIEPSPSPPPSTQARPKRGMASRKPTLVKKTAVDRFNDSRQDESRRLNLKRKMEHEEKMASIRLKRHKYELRYGSTSVGSMHQTPASSTPALATTAATKEDKQIEILRLQIRLAELTRDNSAHVSMTHASSSLASSSRMLHNSLEDRDVSTPSSGMSSLSYHNGFVDNYVPNDEASRETTSWPETYDFTA